MKKVTALIAVCIAIMLLFSGCAVQQTNSEEAAANLPNPMVEVDAGGIAEKFGFDLNVPEGAEDVKYYVVNDEFGEIQFTLDGVEFDARIKACAEFEDISGMNYKWAVEEECTVSGVSGKCMRYIGSRETVDTCLWFDVAPGIMYSLSAVSEDLDGFDISAVAAQVYAPMQGEVG